MTIRDRLFAAPGARAFYGWTLLAVADLGIFAGGPGQSRGRPPALFPRVPLARPAGRV